MVLPLSRAGRMGVRPGGAAESSSSLARFSSRPFS
jgi:hypothetical protein